MSPRPPPGNETLTRYVPPPRRFVSSSNRTLLETSAVPSRVAHDEYRSSLALAGTSPAVMMTRWLLDIVNLNQSTSPLPEACSDTHVEPGADFAEAHVSGASGT